jgi:hypothetical protein
VKLSDATSGAAYKTAAGFLEVYGDYGDSRHGIPAGQSPSGARASGYTGPGGVWCNREP